MIPCRACNGSAVVWQPMMMSTADIPESVNCLRNTEAAKCPICEGRGTVDDNFYEFTVTQKKGCKIFKGNPYDFIPKGYVRKGYSTGRGD